MVEEVCGVILTLPDDPDLLSRHMNHVRDAIAEMNKKWVPGEPFGLSPSEFTILMARHGEKDLELYDRLRENHPGEKFGGNDLTIFEIFEADGRMVLVSGPESIMVQSAPRLSPVDNWQEYIDVRRISNASVWTEEHARLYYGWKSSSFPRPMPTSHDAQVKQELTDLRVQAEAKRILQAERAPEVPLQLLSVADLLTLPEPEWWISSVLPKDSLVIVGGDGGVGKSAMLVEMAARLSTGTPFLGQFATAKARTLYAVGEGMRGYGARFSAVANAHGLDASSVTVVKDVSMTTDKSMEQVRALVERQQFDLVIFDTLSSLSTLESENDAAEVARVLNAAKRVREVRPGCTVVIVHHTNKASGGLRGSSVIRDNADMVWMLRGDPDAFFMSTKSKHGGKVKDGEPMEIHGLSLVGAYGSVVVENAGIPAEGSGAGDRRASNLAAMLESGREHSTSELREMVRADDPDTSEATCKRTITMLVSSGDLATISRGRYRVTKGQNVGGS